LKRSSLPATWHAVRLRAGLLLAGLESRLPPKPQAAAIARGRARNPDEVAAELVQPGGTAA
jgi:hypothetical protein